MYHRGLDRKIIREEEGEVEEEQIVLRKEGEIYENVNLSSFIPKEGVGVVEVIKSVIKNMSPTNPFYRISIPIEVIQPCSLLERMSKHSNPSNFLDNIQNETCPETRFLRMVKWQLSTWKNVNRIGLAGSKPYNPILGEFFTCYWDHPGDGSRTHVLYEQVSHHPPISAFYGENRKRKFIWKGNIYPSLRLQGLNSMGSNVLGNIQAILHPNSEEEVYNFTFPSVVLTGFLWNKPARIEVCSTSKRRGEKFQCRCDQTGYFCEISFKPGSVRKKRNPLKGYIYNTDGEILYTIIGNLDQETFIIQKDGEKEELFVNFDTLIEDDDIFRHVKPLELQKENESRRVWHSVTKNLLRRDLKAAQEEKLMLEEIQRKKKNRVKFFKPKLKKKGKKTDDDDEARGEWVLRGRFRKLLLDGKL